MRIGILKKMSLRRGKAKEKAKSQSRDLNKARKLGWKLKGQQNLVTRSRLTKSKNLKTIKSVVKMKSTCKPRKF